jgi:antitoxin component YwqK of YwqJK toxin-antitoxin module
LINEAHDWTNAQGQTIKAEFVSATNEAVTISMQGKVFVVKLADLNPQSRALAAKLRIQKSTVQKPGTAAEASPVVVDGRRLERRRDGLHYFKGVSYTGIAVVKRANGQKESEITYKDGQKESEITYKDGQKESEITYKDGNPVTAIVWKSNGEKCPDTNLVNGNGIVCKYWDNGKKESEITYKDGRKHGLETWWYKDGQMKSEITYKDGEMDGLNTTRHDNDLKASNTNHRWSEVTYKGGKKHGPYTLYVRHGGRRTDQDENGEKDEGGAYKDGEMDGLWTEWYMDGRKYKERTYKNGRLHGLSTTWHINGQKESEGIFKDDEKHGLHTSWHMKGRKEVWIYNGARITIKDPTKKPAEPVLNTGPVKGNSYTIPGLKLDMRWCKSGTFPRSGQHEVTLTQGFYLGKHEVTQLQWEKVMGTNPSGFKGATLPVENVSWYDAMEFCVKLTQMEKAAGRLPEGHVYTLPTEAQWEYACRAGTTTAYSFGNTITHKQANFYRTKWKKNKSTNRFERPVGKTTAIGTYPANAWGFHDMHGNVLEWCSDWAHWKWGYPSGSATDPVGSFGGHKRVHRGGSWREGGGSGLRSAQRSSLSWNARNSYSGFRLSLQPEMKWHKNGQKRSEETYKDGNFWTVVAWKPNGEKCRVTKVVKGNGVWVEYNDDGTEKERLYYKDGEEAKANQSPAAPPDAKPAQVGKIDLDDPKTFKKIIAEAIDRNNLQQRGEKGEELLYRKNKPKPYTGWTKLMDGNGKIKFLTQRKDGKKDGLQMWWHENGQKRGESTFKDGKKDGLWIVYNEDGTEDSRATYKDGKRVED